MTFSIPAFPKNLSTDAETHNVETTMIQLGMGEDFPKNHSADPEAHNVETE